MERLGKIPDVSELFGRIRLVDQQTLALKKAGAPKSEVRALLKDKGRNMVVLLQAKNAGIAYIRTGIVRYGTDDYHQFSQNSVIINTPTDIKAVYPNSKLGIDIMAEGIGATPQDVINIAGKFDFVVRESDQEMVFRTFNEIRDSQRAHKIARSLQRFQEVDELDIFRLFLAERLLRTRLSESNTSVRTKRFRGSRGDILSGIYLGEDDYVVFQNTPQVDELFLNYGGYDKDQLR